MAFKYRLTFKFRSVFYGCGELSNWGKSVKVTIFGATGKGGRAVLAKAVARGYEVTILVRRAIQAPAGVRVIVGDVRNRASIREALSGSDAVLQCLGVGGLGDGRPNSLVPDATRLIIDEMKAAGLRRLVCMGNVGVPGSGAYLIRFLVAPLLARKLRPILAAKIKMEAILRACDLDWTVVRMPVLTERPDRKRIKISPEGRATGISITTGDAANFMLDIIDKRQFFGSAVSVAN